MTSCAEHAAQAEPAAPAETAAQAERTIRAQLDLYPAAIFDMDGTVMNSEIWHHQAWQQMLKDFGLPALTTADLYAYGGMPTLEIAKAVVERFNSDADPQAMSVRKAELYRNEFIKHATVFPKIAALLKELHSAGKRVAIATSSHKFEATQLLTQNGLMPYIDALVTGDLVTRGKPNPDIYLLAAERLNVPPQDCVVFEDTVIGMQGIKNARMAAVKVFEGELDCDHVITLAEPWPQA